MYLLQGHKATVIIPHIIQNEHSGSILICHIKMNVEKVCHSGRDKLRLGSLAVPHNSTEKDRKSENSLP